MPSLTPEQRAELRQKYTHLEELPRMGERLTQKGWGMKAAAEDALSLLDTIDALEASNAALEARVIAAEQSLETLRLRAEVLYASASALLADVNAFCGVRDEAVGTEVDDGQLQRP